ncbi:MAG: peptidase M14, partial [Planctomycetota bacterium]|nr:peptidase M14 [Planctomycetota bacterium]
GTINHLYGVHGAISFTNELYGDEMDFDGDGRTSDEEKMRFNDRLALGRMFVEWEEVDHPQYGTIEVGGYKKDTGRSPEGWMLEEECHRNAAFVLFHAEQMPMLTFDGVRVEDAGGGLWKIYATIRNERAIPSVTAWARRNNLHRLDHATIEGARVVSSGIVQDRWMNRISLQEHRPEVLSVGGVPGNGSRELFFLVEGGAGDEIRIDYDSVKAGRVETSVELREGNGD